MSTGASAKELHAATFEALAKAVSECPNEKLGEFHATFWPMVKEQSIVCRKYEQMGKREEAVENVLTGQGMLKLISNTSYKHDERLKSDSGVKETSEMDFFERNDDRRTEHAIEKAFLKTQNQLLNQKIEDLEKAQAKKTKDLQDTRDCQLVSLTAHNAELLKKLGLANTDILAQHALTDELHVRCRRDEELLLAKDEELKLKDITMRALILRTSAEVEEKEAQIQILKAQKQAAKSTLEGHNIEIAKLHRQRAEDHQECSSDRSKSEVLRLKYEVLSQYKRIVIYEDRIKEQNKQIKEKDRFWRKRFQEQEDEIKTSEEIIDAATKEIDECNEDLENANKKVRRLEECVVALEDQVEGLETAYDELEDAEWEVDRIESENRRLESENQRLHRLRAGEQASCISRHDEKWAESDDEDEESLTSAAAAVQSLLRESFSRAQREWGH